MFRTDYELLFPMKSGTKMVKRVREISGNSDDTKICAYPYGKGKNIYMN